MGDATRRPLVMLVTLTPAARLCAAISEHHQDPDHRCPAVGGGGRGGRHQRCEAERALFAELAQERDAGWPS